MEIDKTAFKKILCRNKYGKVVIEIDYIDIFAKYTVVSYRNIVSTQYYSVSIEMLRIINGIEHEDRQDSV